MIALILILTGAWTNNGIVAVDPGTQLDVAPDGAGRATFTQAGGLVAVDGRMIIDGGLFHFTGGAIWGNFIIRNGQIQVDASAAQPAVISVVGPNNTLLDNAGAATLDVQGGSPVGYGDATLNAADGSTNSGTILLESLDGAHNGYLQVPAGTFTNESGGVIQVNVPPGASGQGSITAGWLAGAGAGGGAGGGAVADSTNQQVLAIYLSLLATLEEHEAEGIPVSPELLAFAMGMVQTAGVNDGVIAVQGVGPGAPMNPLDVLTAFNGSSLLNLGDIQIGFSTDALTSSIPLSQPAPTASANGGSGNSTADLINSLYQVRADLVAPAVAMVGLGQGFETQIPALVTQLAANPQGANNRCQFYFS